MRGLFGELFDFDWDGGLDSFERAAELEFLDELEKEDVDSDFDDDDF